MSPWKRVVQFALVVALASAGMLATRSEAAAFSGVYCAMSCSAMGVCDPHGGTCKPQLCWSDETQQYYTHTLTCNADS